MSDFGSIPVSCRYVVEIGRFAKPCAVEISDIRLAAALWHTSDHSKTTVMMVEFNGLEYSLDLCGYVDAHDIASGRAYGAEIPVDVVEHLEATPEMRAKGLMAIEMEHAPWFQWVDAAGDPVGDVMDSISLEPQVELSKLMELISVNQNEEVKA
jgi:hypothetical protein